MMMKIARTIEFSEFSLVINKYQLLVFHQHRNRPEQHILFDAHHRLSVVRVLHYGISFLNGKS